MATLTFIPISAGIGSRLVFREIWRLPTDSGNSGGYPIRDYIRDESKRDYLRRKKLREEEEKELLEAIALEASINKASAERLHKRRASPGLITLEQIIGKRKAEALEPDKRESLEVKIAAIQARQRRDREDEEIMLFH